MAMDDQLNKDEERLVTYEVLMTLQAKLDSWDGQKRALEERLLWIKMLNRWIDNPVVFTNDSVLEAAIAYRDRCLPKS